MAKHLSEDEIKFIMSVESSQAQQEIHKLTKETKELNRTNQERRNVMRSLEAQGKKDTEYYRNLEAEIKSTNETIKKNKQLVTELEKKLDVTGLTMAQLRAKAKDLRTQLDHTAKSANPEEYAKLEEELKKVNNRMDELRGTGEYAKKEISGFERTMSMAKTAAKGFVAVQLFSYLKSVGTNAYNTRKEFARYEAVLKNATGSGKEASNVMRTLQTLAADTPASVAEWTEAYIKLINRGIKPTTSELTALGDIATSQGKDLDQFIEALLDAMTGENERLKEFGITAQKNGETTAFTFKGVTTEVKNNDQAIKDYIISLGQLQGVQGSMATQMKELGGLESNLGDQMDNIYNKIGKKLEPAIKSFMGWLGGSLGKLSSLLDSSSDSFQKQYDKVFALEEKVPDLTKRYNELTSKTSLSKDEQAELNRLMKELSRIMPGAISGWDEYGNILSINTDKIDEYVASQKRLLAAMNEEEINSTKKKMKDAKNDIAAYQKLLKEGGKWKTDRKTGDMFFIKWTPEQVAEFEENIKEASEIYANQQEYLNELTGKSIEKRLDEKKKEAQMTKEFNGMNKQQLDAWIADEKNAASQYVELAKQIRQSRFPETTTDGNDEESRLKEQEKKVQEALARQTEIYNQQQIELKKKYLAGNDEKLQSETSFNAAMEELALQNLHARLAIFGLEVSERQKIEQQILDIRIKAMQDFYVKKSEIEEQEKQERQKKNQEALADNDTWMQSEMDRLQDEHQKRVDIVTKSLQQQVDSYKEYGTQIGTALGQVLSGQEDMLSAFGGTMIDILFDVLSNIINQKIAEATAVAVAEQAKAAAIAAAQPDSVATFGATAAARTAVIGGLIMAALTTAKTALKGLITKNSKQTVTTSSEGTTYYTRVPGKEDGGYIGVTRQQDGKKFQAVYNPSARGFISRPTVIVGEGPAGMSREWVASNAAVMNPTVSPILSVIDQAQQAGTIRTLDLNKYIASMQLRGKQEGGKINTEVSVPSSNSNISPDLIRKLTDVLSSFDKNGIKAFVALSDIKAKEELRNKAIKKSSKVK